MLNQQLKLRLQKLHKMLEMMTAFLIRKNESLHKLWSNKNLHA